MDAITPRKTAKLYLASAARGEHVDILDAVRGIAAFVVAFMHCRDINWIGMQAHWRLNGHELSLSSILAYVTLPFMYGAIGVPILFVVSGYVIHRRSAKQLSSGALAFSSSRFYLRRLIRIYPTFFAAILLTFLCDRLTRGIVEHYQLGDTSWWTMLSNVAALQGVLAPPFGSNGPLWSLAIEIQFYVVYPLALALRSRIGAGHMLLAALGLTILGYVTLERNGIVAFPQYYLSWWLGAYLADREAEAMPLPVWWPMLPSVLIPLGCYFSSTHAPFPAFVCWATGCAPVLAWLVQLRTPLAMAETPLHRIGHFSYSIYAAHLPLLVLANALLLNGAHSTNIAWSFAIAALTGLTCYVFFLVAERPSIQLLARMTR
jgi:peptidoglycan/LPS O-acetylase OafA/YrhL